MQMFEPEDTSMYAGVIYGLHNGDGDIRYVGQTTRTARSRLSQHKLAARSGKTYAVSNWINKHGEDSIQMIIIETFDSTTIHLLNEREIYHIAQARAMSIGENLNMTDGGDGSLGTAMTPENRAMHSARMSVKMVGNTYRRGTTASEITRTRMSLSRTGKAKSEAHKAALSKSWEGRPPIAQHTRWHVNRNIIKDGCTLCMAG